MPLIPSFRDECDECAKRMMDAFDNVPDAQSARSAVTCCARRVGGSNRVSCCRWRCPMPSEAELLSLVREFYEHADPVPDGLADLAGSLLDLRALTVRWPHVAAIVYPAPDGCVPKRTEIRSRPLPRTGPVAIHAGKKWDPRSAQGDAMLDWVAANGLDGIDLAYCEGKILAVANLTGFHPASEACCPPWGVPGHGDYHWVIDNVRPLAEPVPCRGQLGLWRPDADTLAAVLRQIAAVTR